MTRPARTPAPRTSIFRASSRRSRHGQSAGLRAHDPRIQSAGRNVRARVPGAGIVRRRVRVGCGAQADHDRPAAALCDGLRVQQRWRHFFRRARRRARKWRWSAPDRRASRARANWRKRGHSVTFSKSATGRRPFDLRNHRAARAGGSVAGGSRDDAALGSSDRDRRELGRDLLLADLQSQLRCRLLGVGWARLQPWGSPAKSRFWTVSNTLSRAS